ncbi:MAG: Serine phosphatase RsbU, regulator of sigma subunit [Candidatus Ozemobacter sibiricus]|uniref:Serine phosphatase RsbU, regulator of sigma subunit n=1 Tax=Candidatus Ozemobacter sibiricus TaxID=2268124 RepID=A0A367ZPI7_9BACT|nr:MAG: Serine phosphatase RsbU, regulator of sigma subunit [Candidatus Ozemobacter sibiricus]
MGAGPALVLAGLLCGMPLLLLGVGWEAYCQQAWQVCRQAAAARLERAASSLARSADTSQVVARQLDRFTAALWHGDQWRAAGWRRLLQRPYPRLISRLVFLILVATVLPLGLLSGLTAFYLWDRAAILEERRHAEVLSRLASLDQGFDRGLEAFQQRLQQALRLPPAPAAPLARQIKELAPLWHRRFRPHFQEVFTIEGEALLQGAFHRVTGRQSAVSLRQMRRAAQTVLTALRPDATASAPGDLHLDPLEEELFWEAARQLGKLLRFQVENSHKLLFMWPFYDDHGQALFVIAMAWEMPRLERDYGRRVLPTFLRGEDLITVGTVEQMGEGRWHLARRRHLRLVRHLAQAVGIANLRIRRRVGTGDQTLLLTGLPSRRLHRFALVAISTDQAIRADLASLRQGVSVIVLTILLLAVGVAQILSQQFLVPIAHLEKGVEALRARRFRERLPWTIPIAPKCPNGCSNWWPDRCSPPMPPPACGPTAPSPWKGSWKWPAASTPPPSCASSPATPTGGWTSALAVPTTCCSSGQGIRPPASPSSWPSWGGISSTCRSISSATSAATTPVSPKGPC